ncbi:tannase/feruloyl esterase family alpha/beta hydrolase [Pigmentiphaga sp. CHJ604]|uniref:tannase/feruloyl esterase family alpha/beta hydrolase n=1 Tax=Pigmentiphaga sp. CHJ604 TaxID=3081984 RepID=UPI0030CC67B8
MARPKQHPSPLLRPLPTLPPRAWAAGLLAALGACGGSDDPPAPPPPSPSATLSCDDSMKTAFKPDANTRVILAKAFRQGDALALADTPATPAPAKASQDMCLVKMVVGPGNAGTAGAPSTSPGIGLEVWLPTPANWNQRIRNLGGGGWAGGSQASATQIGNAGAAATAALGYAVGTTDTGHAIAGNGSFAMKEDGTINSALWGDFAERSLHELAVKTKALVEAYYGKPQQYAYWEGCSTGGRQGYKIAQEHPDDYDGYLNGAPAFNWTRFITNELYPQVAMQRDLGGPIAADKLRRVSAAAVSACDTVGGQHLGFIADPGQCRYDPTRDASALCAGVAGNGVVGTSTDAACVSLAEARTINKIWYGQTADGSAPDPQADNASGTTLASRQLWWGLTRGTDLSGLAGSSGTPPVARPFTIATDMVALELQNPAYATSSFINATGNGADKWKDMSYADLANAYDRGIALQAAFGHINTDNPDLTRLRDGGGKVISYHGLADQLITPAGSLNYLSRVADKMGGIEAVQAFNRLYLVPGMGHCAGVGSVSGSAGPAATADTVPLPAANQFFDALVAWVEKGTQPGPLMLKSADASVSMPICVHPQKATYKGSGSATDGANYSCR